MVIIFIIYKRFQNKRAKVKKGNFSPLMDDHDPGNLFTPSKTEKYQGFTPTTLPTPPGSVFLRPSNSFGASEDSNENLSGYPDITSNFGFWNRNSNDGNLPTGPLSFVGPRSEIIRKRPLFCNLFILTLVVDFFNNQAQSLDDHSLLSSIKSSNLEEQFYLKAESSSKDESLVVNFLHPMNPGVRSQTPDLLNGSSNFEAYNIFRDSPDRNLFQP